MIEPSLNMSTTNENTHYEGPTAQFRQIYNLLCMKPGTDILNPDKGIDINSYYYQYTDKNVLNQLSNSIEDQINTYTTFDIKTVDCRAVKSKKDNKYYLCVMIYLFNYKDALLISTDGTSSAFDVLKQ